MSKEKVTKFHCKRAYRGNIVDVRDYILDKVKRDKKKLVITCEGLDGQMTIDHDEIDEKVHKISGDIQSRHYLKNTYKLYSFIYKKDEDNI